MYIEINKLEKRVGMDGTRTWVVVGSIATGTQNINGVMAASLYIFRVRWFIGFDGQNLTVVCFVSCSKFKK